MAQKDIETLKEEIDAAVHPGGGPPLIMGADLNTLLTSLATEVVRAGEPVRIADYGAISSGLESQAANTGEPASHDFAVGDVVGQSGLGLFRCAHAFTLRYDLDVEFSNHHFPLSSPTYWTPIVLNNGGSSGDVVLTDNYGNKYPLTVNDAGSLLIAGNSVVPTSVPNLLMFDAGGSARNITLDAAGTLLIDGQPVVPAFVPSLSLSDPSYTTHTLTVNEAGALLIDGQPVVPASVFSLSLIDPKYTTHTLTVNEGGALVIDGQVATTPLISYTLTGGGDANPQNRQVTLTKILDYQQPGNLPDPELREGGLVVPVRGYYEITSQVTLSANSLTTSQSCGVSGGPVFDWRNIGWVSGAPVTRNLVARTSQRIMLEAGTVVYLYAQFAGPSVPVDGQLNVYLLHAA